MKKNLLLVFISLLILSSTYTLAKSEMEYISFDTSSTMKTIKVKWIKQKEAKYYIIYRKDVTKEVDNMLETEYEVKVKMKDYKKIKKIKSSHKRITFKDKNVKDKHYYAYVIEGYNKKNKLIASSFETGSIEYDCPALETPVLYNDGTGEFHSNTNKVFYLYHETYHGVEPTYIILYRSTDNKKYKKISTIKNNDNKEIKDTRVKKGKTYYYKIRTVKRRFLKKYYSNYSKPVRIPNVNTIAKYKLKVLKSKNNYKIIKLTSKKDNGKLTFSKDLICDSNTDSIENNIKVNSYSKDKKNWINSKKDIDLKQKESVYLNISGKDLNVTEYLNCYDGVSYDGPYAGGSQIIFDFASKQAKVKQFFD